MRTKLRSWLDAARPTSEGALPGQSMVEYALILVFTTLVCVGAVALVGTTTKEHLWDVIDSVINAALTI